MLSYQYRESHCGDKMAIRLFYLHNGIASIGKISLYWNGVLLTIHIYNMCLQGWCMVPYIKLQSYISIPPHTHTSTHIVWPHVACVDSWHLQNYAPVSHSSCYVVFCGSLVPVYVTHILQDCFIGTANNRRTATVPVKQLSRIWLDTYSWLSENMTTTKQSTVKVNTMTS